MKFLSAPIHTIIDNRSLLRQFTKRKLVAENRGSLLGILWLIFQPLLLMSVYTFVFSQIYNGKYGVIENESSTQYALGIFIGITVLHLFNDALGGNVHSIVGSANYVKKIVFPLEIIPLSSVFVVCYKFAISMVLIVLGILFFVGEFPRTFAWLPVILFPSILLSAGIAWIVSTIGVYFRDINPVVQITSLCMLWLSGVFYSARDIPSAAWEVIKYNPVLLNVEMTRNAILWGVEPNTTWLAYSYGVSTFIFFIGYWFFNKMKHTFADIL